MTYSSANMLETSSFRDTQIRRGVTRHAGSREKFLALLLLLVLIRTSEVLAGEQANLMVGPLKPDFRARPDSTHELPALTTPLFELPKTYQTPEPAMNGIQAAGDFRPRGRSVLDRDSQYASVQELPMLRSTTMWQRLADYHSHGRVSLLTLWETGGSSVSLQAGRKGEPSLQWTSHAMNHEGATRGLFDQLLPASMTNSNRNSHAPQRQSGSDAPTRLGKPADIAMMGPIK